MVHFFNFSFSDIFIFMSQEERGKHWIGTLDQSLPKFWEDEVTLSHIEYIKLQLEEGHGETQFRHYQIYMCLKEKKRKSWILKHISKDSSKTNHWECKRGTVAEAIDYVSKEDTRVTGDDAYSFEFGTIPEERGPKKSATKRDREEKAIEVVDELKTRYIPFEGIDSDVLLHPNFVPVYEKLTANRLGPYRPNLKVLCIIGFSGCGKTYAFNKWFHNYVKCIYGNNGAWFQNTFARTLLLDEFNGQIPPQALLELLEGYPHALEIKGGMRPAVYEQVVIFSNVRPENWYASAEEVTRKYSRFSDPDKNCSAATKRSETLKAIFDRIGYSTNGEHSVRKTGKTFIFELPTKYQGPLSRKLQAEKEEWIKNNTWANLEYRMAIAWKELTLSPKPEWKYETEEEEREAAEALQIEVPAAPANLREASDSLFEKPTI